MRRGLVAVAVAVGLVTWGGTAVAPAHAATGPDSISVTITPNPAHVNDTLHVSGDVTNNGSPVMGAVLAITRTDRNGTADMFGATTDANGHYDVPDPMSEPKEIVPYGTVSYDVVETVNSSENSASTWVHRLTPVLRLTSDHSVVTWNHRVHLDASLEPLTSTPPHKVSIWAQPYGGKATQIASGDASTGDITASPVVSRRTTYSARFGGDDTYAPSRVYTTVLARALVVEHLYGGYGTSGGYRLYHASGVPVLRARVFPNLTDVCLWFRAERYYSGAWHKVAVGCIHTDSYGRAEGRFTGKHHLGSPYRVRALWAGNKVATAQTGAWVRLEFR